ncbi:MAG TPA: ATP-binding protein [Actinomycetota bacterium]|nr:ATP-binding protein [Actinomycetota bacterium]
MRQQSDGLEDEAFSIAVRPEPQYVGTARAFAAAMARHFRADEERVQDVKVAISEACTNAIKAHRAISIEEPITLVVRADGTILWYEIADEGGGFDVAGRIAKRPAEGELFEGGIGLMLIRSLFPEAQIEPNPRGGTTVRFPLALESV